MISIRDVKRSFHLQRKHCLLVSWNNTNAKYDLFYLSNDQYVEILKYMYYTSMSPLFCSICSTFSIILRFYVSVNNYFSVLLLSYDSGCLIAFLSCLPNPKLPCFYLSAAKCMHLKGFKNTSSFIHLTFIVLRFILNQKLCLLNL